MSLAGLENLCASIASCTPRQVMGRVVAIERGSVRVVAGQGRLAIGDRVRFHGGMGPYGEVIALSELGAAILVEGPMGGLRVGDAVECLGVPRLAPHDGWLGRLVDPLGRAMDGRALFPGVSPRDLLASPPDPARRREYEAIHPLGRLGRPEDIANAILFLASDEAAWITGEILYVDGGYLIR